MTKMYLVRYSEIFLKSEPVRRRWENALISNIGEVLPECRVRRERGRIWLEGAVDPEKLKKVFGIVSFSECEYCTLENLNSFSLNFCDEIGIDKARTFAVRVKRVGVHDFTSQQKAAELGDLILNKFKYLKVDLESPEKAIFVEIRNEDCYLFDEVIKGVGGIPLGVEGKLVALFSGGIDSPVATWLMMKRGCKIIGFDKVEIERIAREIGTFDASILPASSCSAVPKKPVTKAKLEKVLDVEREVTYDAEF